MDDAVLDVALKILEKFPLCDRCLGRQFAWLSTSTTNQNRGHAIKLALTMELHRNMINHDESAVDKLKIIAENGMFEPAKKVLEKEQIETTQKAKCKICGIESGSVFDKVHELVPKIVELTKDIEFETFLVGSIVPGHVQEFEDDLRAIFNLEFAEPIKSEFNRTLGKALQDAFKKSVDLKNPHLVVLVNLSDFSIDISTNPIFVYGRYKKLVRGISQAKWICKYCGGKGCEKCNYKGRYYEESIEEFICPPILDEAKGTRYKFHAAGREDVDARMLGTGRPFVVEISNPQIRTIDLKKLEKLINENAKGKVEVSDLQFSTRKVLQELKEKSPVSRKVYEALVYVDREISDADIELIEKTFTNLEIRQKTPTRVLNRRSDLTRIKRVYEIEGVKLDSHHMKLRINCQGGLYVKELISGDNGRTTPSIAELLGSPAICEELDVILVERNIKN